MKNIQSLIDQYEADFEKNTVFPELKIIPRDRETGLIIYLTGVFPEDSLDQSTITDFVITGLLFDNIKIEQSDEDFFFDLARAVMAGQYRYAIHKESLIEKLLGGVAYLTIGNKESPLLSNFKCVEQIRVKKLIRNGKLNTIAYIARNW